MGAIWWGTWGTCTPHFFRRGGTWYVMSPHFFLFRFCIWRGFKIESDVCHVLCEEFFMLDGRPHVAKLMLKQSLVWQWCSQTVTFYTETDTWLKFRDETETSSKTPTIEVWDRDSRLQNLCVLPKLKKNVVITSDLNFFQISGIFPTCFGCFLPTNTTNKNLWIIQIFINHFFTVFKVSRPETFETETRPETFETKTETETGKNGSRDLITVVWYHWFRKFINFSFDKTIFSIFQVCRDRERCLTASVRDFILRGILLESFFSCNSESITAAHVRDHSTAMICSEQKCNWFCCNVGCHVFRNRQRNNLMILVCIMLES